MMTLHDLGELQRAMSVRQPMEIYAKDSRRESGYSSFCIVGRIRDHPLRNVDDAHVVAMCLQMASNAREPYRIHLKGGRRKNEIADRAIFRPGLTKVVDTRRMEEYKIGAE